MTSASNFDLCRRVGVFFVGAEPCVWARFSPSQGGNVAFRRLVVRPSRLHSAVAAATALQTATRRRGTKIRRPVPRSGGDAQTGRETVSFRFDFFAFTLFSFRNATFYTLSVSSRDGG